VTVALSPGERLLASGGKDGIRLWEVATGRELSPKSLGHHKNVTTLAFSPDGTVLASAGGNSIVFWDISGITPLITANHEDGTIHKIKFSPDGRFLASADSKKRLILWGNWR
jgi:WD40 repeat protein